MKTRLASICIPSYNRVESLHRLLGSIDDSCSADIDVVVCEDHSEARNNIRRMISEFRSNSKLTLSYYENRRNFGYDRNLRELIGKATGKFIIFMGDDDVFVSGQMPKYIKFLKSNPELGYVLRPFERVHTNGEVESFKYYSATRFFGPGSDSYVELFRKSIFISGFTINRSYARQFMTDEFDGTLLFQLYLLAEVTLHYPSAFCDIHLTRQFVANTVPLFGSSDAEKALFTPGEISVVNSVNFMKGFFKIARFMDSKYDLQSASRIRLDISRYSYSVLAVQRHRGLATFMKYVQLLNKEVRIDVTIYYYIYVVLLSFLGKPACDKLIIATKRLLGKTPSL